MLTIILGDITKVKTNTEYICNAANGIGFMSGGVARALKKNGGLTIELEALKECFKHNPKAGDLYITNSGSLPYKKIIHLVTMKIPGFNSNYFNVEKCLNSLIAYCKNNNIESVALPALGTGVGGLKKEKVAQLYKDILGNEATINFVIVDKNEEFIRCLLQK